MERKWNCNFCRHGSFHRFQMEIKYCVASCKGLDKIAHTNENIDDSTYKGLFDAGVGPDLDTIHEYIHVCTLDEGSNILKAWSEIEGAGCVCRREQNCLGVALSLPCILPVLKKIKAIFPQLHRSDKVLTHGYSLSLFCRDLVGSSMM
jgi:hypothetical protein